MNTEVIVAIISALALIITGVIAYKKDIRIKKIEIENKEMKSQLTSGDDILTESNIKITILDKLANFAIFNQIKTSADRMFKETKADQFLILFALNGKRDFRTVSVVFEQHQHPKWAVNSIIRYRDVQIDDDYRRLLKNVEAFGEVDVDISTMPNQLLKDFYLIEHVKHAKIKFLHRKSLDESNDMVMFSSIATHENEAFNNLESAIIKTEFEGTISHVIKNYI